MIYIKKFGAGDGIRTHDFNLGKVALYPWATPDCSSVSLNSLIKPTTYLLVYSNRFQIKSIINPDISALSVPELCQRSIGGRGLILDLVIFISSCKFMKAIRLSILCKDLVFPTIFNAKFIFAWDFNKLYFILFYTYILLTLYY